MQQINLSPTSRTVLIGYRLQEDWENSLSSLFFVFSLSAEKPEYTNIKLAVSQWVNIFFYAGSQHKSEHCFGFFVLSPGENLQ